eukprot:1711808-Prymnesium_polylepis.1
MDTCGASEGARVAGDGWSARAVKYELGTRTLDTTDAGAGMRTGMHRRGGKRQATRDGGGPAVRGDPDDQIVPGRKKDEMIEMDVIVTYACRYRRAVPVEPESGRSPAHEIEPGRLAVSDTVHATTATLQLGIAYRWAGGLLSPPYTTLAR